ncbi:MAG: Ig-like domain-containing protein [Gemmatimonadales bacterium]
MPFRSIRDPLGPVAWASIVATGVLASCSGGSEPVPPPPPAERLRLEVLGAATFEGPAGTIVEPAPRVRVRDSKGPVAGGLITFDFRGASPTVTRPAGDDGTAEALWALPRSVGIVTMAARVAGGDSAVFTAEVLPPGPPSMSIEDVPRTAKVGQLAGGTATVRVLDAFGDPVPGIAFHFQVQTGGGVLTGSDPVTDSTGRASLGSWRFGPRMHFQSLLVLGPAGLRDSFVVAVAPARFEIASDTIQRIHVNKEAPQRPTVRAWDALGDPMVEVFVDFNGFYVQTDSTGTARFPTPWTAPSEPGEYFVNASTLEYPHPFVFRMVAVVPGPARVDVVAGQGQRGLAGNFLGTRPELRFYDSTGALLPNLDVTWSIAGGGRANRATGRTDHNGTAINEGWRLGPAPGSQTLIAAVPLLPPVTLTAIADPPPARAYHIGYRVTSKSGLSRNDSLTIERAIERWTRAILADLPDLPVTVADSVCGAAVDEPVDDLLVLVSMEWIDGQGQV